MSQKQATQWIDIASKFQEAAKVQKSVLSDQYNAFNRGWLGGFQIGRQKALMFAYSANTDSSQIPECLKTELPDEELFEAFLDFLISKLVSPDDDVDMENLDANYEMSEMEEFRLGRLTGLRDWKSTGGS